MIGIALGLLLPLLPPAPGRLEAPEAGGERAVRFSRDVRPILSDRCFACHGPDEAARKAGLRLDLQPGALARLDSGRRAIVPGAAAESELLRRVRLDDPGERMPPPETGDALTAEEVDVLRRWIEEGSEWEEHWSFVPPRRPAPPSVSAPELARNEIDAFVLARLEGSGLVPTPDADRATLLRRATYDLTGLPPTPAELDAFLADTEAGAWERALDRLFASPRHGEHMARPWLDAARYADTHGLHLDNERTMWPYRDWVVRAFQRNLPFDRFVIEQLAGDLLPEPTLDQLVASGFNRCNPTSAEGGMIEKEYLSIYAKDRVDTTATVFLGLTLECSKCHDHKFDPFSQREYYELLGFFNSLAEEATDRNIANPVPFLRVPDAAQQARLDELDAAIASLAVTVDAPMPEVDAAQAAWEAEWRARLADRWRILVPDEATAANGTTFAILDDDSILAGGPNPAQEVVEVRAHVGEERVSALRLEALVGGGNAEQVPGRSPNQNFVLTGVEVEAFPPGRPAEAVAIPLVEAFAEHSQDQYAIRAAIDGNAGTGWGGLGREGSRSAIFVPERPFGYPGGTEVRVRLRYESRFAQHVIGRFRLAIAEDPDLGRSTLGTWSRLGPFVDPDGRAALAKDYGPESAAVDGWIEEPGYTDGEIHLFANEPGAVYVRRTIDAPSARVLRAGVGSDDGVRVWLNGALVHDNPAPRSVALDQDTVELPLRAGENELLLKVANYGGGLGFAFRRLTEEVGGAPLDVTLALETPPDARGDAQRALLRDHFRRRHAPAWIALNEELAALRAERVGLEATLPTTLISRELDEPRPAHVLVRGQYDAEAERVERDVPDVLPPFPADAPRDRLGLAQWLVSGEHPLTARVYVNRLWMQLFGYGLVRTPEDFGSQGKYPTHPDLLDWLACEFVDSGWDVRHLLRLIMTSSAYRRDSRAAADALALDPENELLARGPRWRHDGEVLRDTALFLAGLLVEDVGGPPVRPYQPPGVWKAVGYTSSNTANYAMGAGEALYRRSLYTFWKRTAPPPNMVTFDAPSREACTVQRARTNTPMQALVLLNDPQFVEAARRFARRALTEGGADDDARLAWAFRAATSRFPDADELDVLRQVLDAQRAHFAADPAGAEALLDVGEAPRDAALPAAEHAAWTNVTSLLLNLDETVSRS